MTQNQKVDILLGLQWGDEGKGKVVDVLTPRYDIVARFQGGPNAGHTLEFDGRKVVLRSIPSGVFQGNINVIGNGVVLDPVLFASEAADLIDSGTPLKSILKISRKAHLILPTHRLLDAALEAAKGSGKIGTTGKGIGPTYTDKVSRCGLRVGDLEAPDFSERLHNATEAHVRRIEALGMKVDREALASLTSAWLEAAAFLREFEFIDSEHYINKALDSGRSVLCEGAQGSMLDIDFGSYPFVTSSNTVSAGACTGLGVAPRRVGEVYGIFKAYCTRVGSGPFPTELFDETGAELRRIGHEFGAVTGRERRCGWLDLVALKYAVMINGVTQLIMMKSDVMNDFETIRVATAYRIGDRVTDEFPYSIDADVEPVYTDFEGWRCDLRACRTYADFPEAFKRYVDFIERETGVPVKIVSVGPDRDETVIR